MQVLSLPLTAEALPAALAVMMTSIGAGDARNDEFAHEFAAAIQAVAVHKFAAAIALHASPGIAMAVGCC